LSTAIEPQPLHQRPLRPPKDLAVSTQGVSERFEEHQRGTARNPVETTDFALT
jgi:hypothetical protein